MNKLITTDTGGFPYVLDDIRWEQDAYRTALLDFSSAVRNSASADCVLWGCIVTDNTTTYDVSAGAVIINGEIYHVTATTGVTKVALKRLAIQASTGTYDASGLKTFQDAVTHNTYEIRKANVVMESVLGEIELSTMGAASIPLKPDYFALNYSGDVNEITLGNTAIDTTGSYYATNSIVAAAEPVKYWKRGNMIEIKGGFSQNPATSVTTRYKVGSLPSGYRPASPALVNGFAVNNAGKEWCLFEIEAGGDIYLRGDIFNTINATGATFHATQGIVINGAFCL